MIFAAENVDLNRLSFDLLNARSPPYKNIKFWVGLSATYILI